MTTWLLQAARAIRSLSWSRRAWPTMLMMAPLACCELAPASGEESPLAGPRLETPQAAPPVRPVELSRRSMQIGVPLIHGNLSAYKQALAPSPRTQLTDRCGPKGYSPLENWQSAQNALRPPEPVAQIETPFAPPARQKQPSAAPSRPGLESTYLPLQRWQTAQQIAHSPKDQATQDAKAPIHRLPPVRREPVKSTYSAGNAAHTDGSSPFVTQSAYLASHRRLPQAESSPAEPVLKSAEPAQPQVPTQGRLLPGDRTQAETVDAPLVLPEPDGVFEIDLPTTIRLVLSANPTVAGAREAVREVLALQQRARSMLLPSLNAGTAYHKHEGNFQASTGQIKDIYSQSLYFGGGSRVWAAESLAVPMVRLFAHLGDAIYEPLAVRQEVATKQYDSRATANTLMLNAIIRYFDLLNAEGRYLAAKQTELETAEIVRITASYAVTGQGREGDANRARTEAYLMHTEVQLAEGRVAEASARLAELLSLDPTTRLKTVGGPIAGVNLFGPREDLEPLIRMAERRRPELAAASATVQTNATRLRQEQTRPLFPLVSLGFSAGSFGGGSVLFPPKMSNFGGRNDFDVLALWSLQNLGVGNYATVSERRAVMNQSRAERTRALNGVRQEVIASYGLLQGERIQILITQRQLKDTEEGFREEFQRLRGAEALPIEVLNSVNQLGFARQELIKAVTAFNQAQFRLLVATGIPPTQALNRGLDQPLAASGNPE